LGVLKKSRNPVPSPRLTTVFQRLRWPEEIRNSLSVSSKNTDIEGQVRKLHWKRKDNPKPPKDHHSEFIDRGKKPMIDSSPTVCSVCIRGDSLPSCQNWATCVKCKQKGHLDRHCRAKWQPTGRKVNLHHVCSGRKTNPNEAATSKEPIYPLLIDITTDSVDDPSIAIPNTELSLFFRTHNPPKLRQISSPSETFVQLVGALPQSSQQMAYQRADPRPFTPRGFHPLVIQHHEFMARAVVNRAPATHEDFAISSFSRSRVMQCILVLFKSFCMSS
jgi:hypothetical protein